MNNKRVSSSTEGQTPDPFLKRLRTIGQRRRKYSKAVVRIRLGPAAEEYEFPLLPLSINSLYFRRRIEPQIDDDSRSDNAEGPAVIVIDLPDFQCSPDIVRMVEEFCHGVMEESEISTSNVVQFFNVATFLEMKSLTCKALAFLQNNSWESCLAVLATFDSEDPLSQDTDTTEYPQVESETDFEMCECDDCLEVRTALARDPLRPPPLIPWQRGHGPCLLDHSPPIANLDAGLERDESHSSKGDALNLEDSEPSCDASVEETEEKWCEESNFYKICRNEFVKKIGVRLSNCKKWTRSCSVQSLLSVAELLPPTAATLIYQSCRVEGFGLFLDGNICNDYPGTIDYTPSSFAISSHRKGDPKRGSTPESETIVHPNDFAFACPLHNRNAEVAWTEQLPELLPDISRRSHLILHFSRMMRVASDAAVPTRSIRSSLLNWGFLCALLVEATRLSKLAATNEVATGLAEEMVFLQRLVSEGLAWGSEHSDSDPEEERVPMTMLLMKLEFGTLVSVVVHFRSFVSYQNIEGVAMMIDSCLQQHLKASSFTMQQAFSILKEFPNHARPCHFGLYKTLMMKTLSADEVIELAKLLDYDKLSDEIVENLLEIFALGNCEPRFVKRLKEIQRKKRNKKEKSNDQELGRLQSDCELQTKGFLKAQDEKKKSEEMLEIELKRLVDFQHKIVVSLENEVNIQTQLLLLATDSKWSAERKLKEFMIMRSRRGQIVERG